ncbi:MAG: dihydroorotase, partial [Polaribacter sp.]
MNRTLIKNAQIVNENIVFKGDLLIENNIIKEISENISVSENTKIIDANGGFLLPG